jgi:hypothetical protein
MEHSQGVNGDIIKMHMQNTSTRLIIRHEDEWSIHKVFAGDIIKCICTTQVHTLKQAYTLGTCIPTSTKEISTHTQQGTFLPTKQISIHTQRQLFPALSKEINTHTHTARHISPCQANQHTCTQRQFPSLPCPRCWSPCVGPAHPDRQSR